MSHTFQDNQGRTWSVGFDPDARRRVRDLLGADVRVLDGDWWRRLADGPGAFVDLLYVLCLPQAEAAGVSDEEFGRSMVGTPARAALAAVIRAAAAHAPSTVREHMNRKE